MLGWFKRNVDLNQPERRFQWTKNKLDDCGVKY